MKVPQGGQDSGQATGVSGSSPGLAEPCREPEMIDKSKIIK